MLGKLPKWRRRFWIYKLFETLPYGQWLFDNVRATAGLNRHFDLGRRHYAMTEMWALLQAADKSIEGKVLLEIGTGWHPLMPAFLYGLGAKKIIMTDIQPHIQPRYVRQTLDYLQTHVAQLSDLTAIPANILQRRWQNLAFLGDNWQTVWANAGIHYHITDDLSQTTAKHSMDVIYSNSCLSYVPAPILKHLFKQSHDLLDEHGWLMHNVMPYDDYSSTDTEIDALNFLRYDHDRWEKQGNCALHYQNRYRPYQYKQLLDETGFSLNTEIRHVHHLKNMSIDRQQLDPAYQQLDEIELRCAHYLFLAEKNPASGDRNGVNAFGD